MEKKYPKYVVFTKSVNFAKQGIDSSYIMNKIHFLETLILQVFYSHGIKDILSVAVWSSGMFFKVEIFL